MILQQENHTTTTRTAQPCGKSQKGECEAQFSRPPCKNLQSPTHAFFWILDREAEKAAGIVSDEEPYEKDQHEAAKDTSEDYSSNMDNANLNHARSASAGQRASLKQGMEVPMPDESTLGGNVW